MASPESMGSAMEASMEARTGRTLDEWVATVVGSGVDELDQKAVRKWLREVHDVPLNSQWAIARAAAKQAGWIEPDVEGYAAKQYSGAKSTLRPIYDRVRDVVLSAGKAVTAAGRSTYIPFTHNRQFAAVKAASRSRVDLGLRFTDPPESELLSTATPIGQTTHKIGLKSVDDVTPEVVELVVAAYEQN
ncbi:uncharacterized protein AMSG_07294 [Thecamonas trahens ATCC 50062]|uniref:DUF5655 domain-containing protein n=1 Tax=Thecamonas trahens ATCC 50062 TaxID=461836 RepID=A0A0L0DG11_THETB|nr:hypothetical protein AMSG_07294 [Thecamonas trahens ATCC 50062]KNC51287.1 hypothetical protein AMSG_07294 [Thecamonas trahens ATCC 50062]|eukprot:XP_013756212.1 hypothetical protein AMSG_07294 [Thecamonas trahens ATCC 50062]